MSATPQQSSHDEGKDGAAFTVEVSGREDNTHWTTATRDGRKWLPHHQSFLLKER